MALRYFSSQPLQCQQSSSIDGQEAAHIIKAMRVKVGQELLFFDGSGFEFLTTVSQVGRSQIQIDVLEKMPRDTELDDRILIAAAVPKGDRSRFLLEKITELGADSFLPVEFQRSEKHSTSALKKADKWVIEASKQCGRTKLLRILSPQKFSLVAESLHPIAEKKVALAPSDLPVSGKTAADPTSNQPADSTDPENNSLAENPFGVTKALLVGPEGGFTEEEVTLAIQSGFQPIHLGKSVLRIETAVIAGLSRLIPMA